MEFKVIKLDRKRNNVVLSRRAVVEASMGEERAKLMETLPEGAIVHGVVKNITEYGAFVDLGGIDGLLHITDMAWRRVRHPSEVVQVGQELHAKVLKFDAEKNRVSLGIKQLGDDPWHGVSRRYPQGTRLFGKVTNIADYGAFVEIEPGIEGLVHVSEMDWTNKNVAPSKIVSLGDEVEVMVLEIDEDKRRISLGMKQCKANPWEEFAATVKRGDSVKGPVKSITDFGVFVGLAAGIDGLVHLSDLSWHEPGETAVRNYKKGQEVEAIVLAVDVERERISLGIKQLDSDPFTSFTSVNDRGAMVTGKVKTVDARGAEIQLNDDVTGYLRASEISRDRVEDARNVLKEGDEVSAMIINVDRKTRSIQLSIKAKDNADQQEAMQRLSQASERENAGTTSLGALLRAKLDNQNQDCLSPGLGACAAPLTRSDLVDPAGRAIRPADPPRHRVRGEDDPRCDVRRAGARPPHRDPRLRQLLDQPPPAARGPQPALRRAGRRSPKSWCRTSSRARRCARRSTSASARSRAAADAEAARRAASAGNRPSQLESRATMRMLVWLVRAAVFFTLFAFALNNQQEVDACTGSSATSGARRWSSSCSPRSALGCAFGVFAMVPSWWRHRRMARNRMRRAERPAVDGARDRSPAEVAPLHPPRDGL